MREIINVQCGQCGNQMGLKFWETVANEHGLNEAGIYCGQSNLQLQRINVYFDESSSGRYVPRSILVDLDMMALENVKASNYGCLFRPDNFIYGRDSAGNNWAKGYYTYGLEISDSIMESIRQESERCDCLQGFQMMHSLGGGCGSGLGSLIINLLKDDFPDRIILTMSVFPSLKLSGTVTEPYNTVLTLSELMQFTDETLCIDNESLFRMAQQGLGIHRPSFGDMNHLGAIALSGSTCCFRFPGQLNTDLRKLANNMIPFSRLHFFIPGFAPLYSIRSANFLKVSVKDLIQESLSARAFMADCNPKTGKYLTLAYIFRGRVSMREVEHEIALMREHNASSFVSWIPNNLKTAACDIPLCGIPSSVTFLANTTAINTLWKRMDNAFVSMFKKKAFLHWFTDQGMEESQFKKAHIDLLDLIDDYFQYQLAD